MKDSVSDWCVASRRSFLADVLRRAAAAAYLSPDLQAPRDSATQACSHLHLVSRPGLSERVEAADLSDVRCDCQC